MTHTTRRSLLACLFVACLLFAPLASKAQNQDERRGNPIVTDNQFLQNLVDRAARETLARFAAAGLKADELAITLVELSKPQTNSTPDKRTRVSNAASHRGATPIYPASVVKMFYLVAAHRQMEDGKLADTPELRRAMRDMIVDSSNDATHYVLDALTGTTSGVELPEAEMRVWSDKRNAVNRYFAAEGFTNINANQKPWCEGPYGRERVFVRNEKASALKDAPNNRNMLTTMATARLLTEIATGTSITADRSRQMMELMRRDPFAESSDVDDQSRGFTGIAFTNPNLTGARLWSKAGWTSTTRHDAAYIELPNGRRFVLVTFTVNRSKERDIIPTVARAIIAGFDKAESAAASAP